MDLSGHGNTRVQIEKVSGPLQLEVFGEKLLPPENSARKGADASAN